MKPCGYLLVPAVAMLAVVLAAGPVGWLATRGQARKSSATLAEVAGQAGCDLREFEDRMRTNPPVSGRFRERNRVADGSYAGKRAPSLAATTHALFHGRVLLQYRPRLSVADLRRLD